MLPQQQVLFTIHPPLGLGSHTLSPFRPWFPGWCPHVPPCPGANLNRVKGAAHEGTIHTHKCHIALTYFDCSGSILAAIVKPLSISTYSPASRTVRNLRHGYVSVARTSQGAQHIINGTGIC